MLLVFVVASIILIVKLFRAEPEPGSYKILILCIAGGVLGSGISALISVLGRISDGWELSSGTKIPSKKNPDKFVARMAPFFIGRPFLGAAMGILIYTGIKSGYLILVREADKPSFSPEGLLFFSILGGLFAKTFLVKLERV